MTDVLLKVVDKEGTAGTVHAEFPVNLEKAEFTPGGADPGEASWTVSPFEPGLAELRKEHLAGFREVQLWDLAGDKCRWWGVPLTFDLEDAQTMRYRARDLKWHLLRRFTGPIRNNLWSPNPDFEDDLDEWTAVGSGLTATASSEWKALGTKSAKLVQTTAGVDSFLRRRVTITTTTDPVFYAAKALLRVLSAGWGGAALGERGLYLELQESAGGALVAGVDPRWAAINEATPRDSFDPVYLETGITAPAGLTDACIEGRLYAPEGTAYYDHTGLFTEESVGSALDGDPVDVVFTALTNYANDPAWGKSGLAIPVTVVGGSGPDIIRHHQFYRSENILELMNQYVREGLLEWDFEWPDDGSERGITVWTAGRGSVIPSGTFKIQFPGNVTSLRYGADGTQVTTKARFTGRGSKATQDVYEAEDTSQMGGLTLESVDSAPDSTPTDGLYRLAAQKVARHRAPTDSDGYWLPDSLVFGTLGIGDTVTVEHDYGPAITGTVTKRIGALEWNGTAVLPSWEDAA